MINVYFENIKSLIINTISSADKSIWIASCYFTDKDIFRILCTLAEKGKEVKLMISDEPINFFNNKVNYQELIDVNGYFLVANKIVNNNRLMHHKFCIIDEKKIITGSYNWTHKAVNNIENIVIIEDVKTASEYKEEFIKIEEKYANRQIDWSSKTISTGFESIDKITGGFSPGELIIIAGKPNMAHEILALNIALITARDLSTSIAYITPDKSGENILSQLLFINSGISKHNFKGEEWIKFQSSLTKLVDFKIHVQSDISSIDEIEKKLKFLNIKGYN